MTLRTRLLLAQAPMAAALLLLGLFSLRTTAALSVSSQEILKDNFRSVLALQRMSGALDRLDALAVRRSLGGEVQPAALAAQRERFESELRLQEGNITEVGEAEATLRLRGAWRDFSSVDGAPAAGTPEEARRLYLESLAPALLAVRTPLEGLVALNMDALLRKNDQVRRDAARYDAFLVTATLLACLLGLLTSATLTSRLLRRLGILTQAVRRIGEGDLDARITLAGRDELAALAREFNLMTERLRGYQRSTLGELLEAQQSGQAAIDSLDDPVLIFDARRGLANGNAAAERLLSLEAGRTAAQIAAAFPQLGEVLERLAAHVLGGKGHLAPRGFEEALRLPTAEGDRYLLPRATPRYAAEGGISGLTVVLQDVTRVRVFDELKNDLVATVAHEFRTPLTSLRMAIHLCLEGMAGPLTAKQEELLHAAREDCERLQAMVDELLDVARIQAGRLELQRRRVAVEALLEGVLPPLRDEAQERGLELRDEPAPQGLAIDADPERLSLVFDNLLRNALAHTPRGGRIALRVRRVEGLVRFEVADTGPGISPQYRERIFDKFFQVPGKGTGGAGLGLYITREIVRAHGGEIGLAGSSAEGSTFWFTVPVFEAPPG